VAYLLLAIYLGNVLPNEVGARRPCYYPLLPSYWLPRPAQRAGALRAVMDQEARRLRQPPAEGPAEEEVAAEEERMRTLLLQRTGAGGGGAGWPLGLGGLARVGVMWLGVQGRPQHQQSVPYSIQH